MTSFSTTYTIYKIMEVPIIPMIGIASSFIVLLILTTAYVFRMRKKRAAMLVDEELAEFQDKEKYARNSEDVFYSSNFEIARDKININKKEILGEGQFGRVFKGTQKIAPNKSKTVAVKTLKFKRDAAYFRSLVQELKTMISIGKHDHVVELIGACTEEMRNGILYIVLEYCINGSLEKYLKNSRSSFVNMFKDGVLNYTAADERAMYRTRVDTLQLIRWSSQIAAGMDFLNSKQIIHCDLATRNILLGKDLEAKVADFGMSKRPHNDGKHVGKTKVPWRWMAPESLDSNVFSTQSDVWMYGVTLWEIFSLAQIPFAGLTFDERFRNQFAKNIRLARPIYASSKIYYVMVRCWDEEPKNRPTFKELAQYFYRMVHNSNCDSENYESETAQS